MTPADGGAQDVLAGMLETLGFTVHRLRFGEIENLFARLGTGGPHICFAGHTDVVPVGRGELAQRSVRRRGAGRRAVWPRRLRHEGRDRRLRRRRGAAPGGRRRKGSISFLITGDEEGPAVDGTVQGAGVDASRTTRSPISAWSANQPAPCSSATWSRSAAAAASTCKIEVHGTQGHVAYPHRADNPVHRLVRALPALTAAPVDAGTDWFEPSTLQVTSIDVGNTATNVIPRLGAGRAEHPLQRRRTAARR